MRLISWLDWFHKVCLLPISAPEAVQLAPQLKREDLLSAIHCIEPSGRVHRGARALRFIGMRLPLMVPVALLLWLPGVISICEIIYNWVSRNRYILSKIFRCKEACSLLPEKTPRK